MIKLIINADDFGYSTEINRAILELVEAKKVTSATAMANAPAFEEAAAATKKHPQCSFGLHLVLTEFKSLSTHPAFLEKGLVDQNGVFLGEEKLVNAKPSLSLINAAIAEWRAQYNKAIACGMEISHIDSHQHVHTIPWLFPALKVFQRKTGIKLVRTTKNLYSDQEAPQSKKLIALKKLWHLSLTNLVATKSTDYFTSFDSFLSLMQLDRVPRGSVEVMCHPGHLSFEKETALLRSNWEDSFHGKFDKASYFQL